MRGKAPWPSITFTRWNSAAINAAAPYIDAPPCGWRLPVTAEDLRGLLRLVPGQQSGVVHLVEQTALAWLESVECGRDCTVADAVEREGQLVVVPVVIGALVEHEVGVLLDDGGHVVLLVEVESRGVDTAGDIGHPRAPALRRPTEQSVVQLRIAVVEVHPNHGAPLRIQHGVPEVVGVHLTETLVPLNLHFAF